MPTVEKADTPANRQLLKDVANNKNNYLETDKYGNQRYSETNQIKGYYLYNGRGDVTTIINEDGDILNTYEYDSFGVIINSSETIDNPFRYAGYYYDVETGNYYLLSRYYNPEIARFISEDTYRGELNDPLSLNRYVYVVNNPLIYTDPNGQAPIPLITGGIGGLFGLGATFVQDLFDDWKINTNWETYAGNTAQGAITGAMLGMPGANVLLAGFGGGFTGNIANQLITTHGSEVNFDQAAINGLTTAVTAGTFSVTGQVTSTGLNYIKDYAIRGAFAGATGDVTYQYLNNGITRDEYGNVTGYSINQAIDNYNPVQTIKTGIAGSILAPVGAKIVETSINKLGPYRNFDLNNPESFKGAKLKNVERYLDKNINGKNGYEKALIKKGTGVRYYKPNGGGKSYQLNYGYDKPIANGADNIHIKPYLKTTVGSEKIHIPLK